MRHLYNLILYLLIPVVLIRLLWRSLKAPHYRQRIAERFALLQLPHIQPNGVWIHAVSVGEVQASAPLITHFLQTYPQLPLIVTTTTPTGSQHLTNLFGSKVLHIYAPYDLSSVVRRFLDRIQPRLAIFMETEIWPNILYHCKQRQISTLLANARLSKRSAHGYSKLQPFTQTVFCYFDQIAVQYEADAQRFMALGVPNAKIKITGSIKFDIHLPPSIHEQAAFIKRLWGVNRPVWIAASTHEGEDDQILTALAKVLKVLPNSLLVLVPRHPERFGKVKHLVQKQGFNIVLRSENRACSPETQVFLGDSMGELPMFLATADIAFVGGSLVPHGGHNLLEPAALGIPIVTGPYLMNFAYIAEMLLAVGAMRQIRSAQELATVIITWLQNAELRTQVGEHGREVVKRNRGALSKLISSIECILQNTTIE